MHEGNELNSQRILWLRARPKNSGRSRRFRANWPVIVRGWDDSGEPFQELAVLRNLSSGGAGISLVQRPMPGTRVEIDVQTPFGTRWLRYQGRVIYVREAIGYRSVGICYESAMPSFVPAAAIWRLTGIAERTCQIH